VHIQANVPEVSSWYRTAHAAIVPLFAGSGTRIKILEAWAHHTPVVSTSMGIEGISTQGALIADSAPAFASACATLLRSPELATSLANVGHQLWQEDYSLSSFQHHISLAVDKVLTP
jgi:glycosyltransferase involved in cell wall biosynthesis